MAGWRQIRAPRHTGLLRDAVLHVFVLEIRRVWVGSVQRDLAQQQTQTVWRRLNENRRELEREMNGQELTNTQENVGVTGDKIDVDEQSEEPWVVGWNILPWRLNMTRASWMDSPLVEARGLSTSGAMAFCRPPNSSAFCKLKSAILAIFAGGASSTIVVEDGSLSFGVSHFATQRRMLLECLVQASIRVRGAFPIRVKCGCGVRHREYVACAATGGIMIAAVEQDIVWSKAQFAPPGFRSHVAKFEDAGKGVDTEGDTMGIMMAIQCKRQIHAGPIYRSRLTKETRRDNHAVSTSTSQLESQRRNPIDLMLSDIAARAATKGLTFAGEPVIEISDNAGQGKMPVSVSSRALKICSYPRTTSICEMRGIIRSSDATQCADGGASSCAMTVQQFVKFITARQFQVEDSQGRKMHARQQQDDGDIVGQFEVQMLEKSPGREHSCSIGRRQFTTTDESERRMRYIRCSGGNHPEIVPGGRKFRGAIDEDEKPAVVLIVDGSESEIDRNCVEIFSEMQRGMAGANTSSSDSSPANGAVNPSRMVRVDMPALSIQKASASAQMGSWTNIIVQRKSPGFAYSANDIAPIEKLDIGGPVQEPMIRGGDAEECRHDLVEHSNERRIERHPMDEGM
ncbi:hypothetical protein C8F04DRAFT_1199469 [Mycena alexandri]|uniref:Uncharacterized protein n=1 Tax=Mycena alexandri TaxID=1745969 RepID=A0AAD6RZZ4_9AGAR|nr:hypothetical protein C8F04DRAFT_1199469 [Mycena alexandri]